MSDVASYLKPNEQATSGAGAVALLVGPEPCVALLPGRASHFANSLDFYKPDPGSNFPVVRGKESIDFYIKSLLVCWARLKRRSGGSLLDFDFFCLHSPFTKQVRKGFLALLFQELVTDARFAARLDADPARKEALLELRRKGASFYDATVQAVVKPLFRALLLGKVEPGLEIPARVGNIYTGSLYLSLISLVYSRRARLASLRGKRVLLYSYGSGLASSVLQAQFTRRDCSLLLDFAALRRDCEAVNRISCAAFFQIKAARTARFGQKDFSTPIAGLDWRAELPAALQNQLWPEAFYLASVDGDFRRRYSFLSAADRLQDPRFPEGRSLGAMRLSARKKLRQMPLAERQRHVAEALATPGLERLLRTGGLSEQSADLMTENCVGRIALPLSLLQGLRLNGKVYAVPMSTEEASVVAGANRSIKTVCAAGTGFWGKTASNVIRGSIFVVDFDSLELGAFERAAPAKSAGRGAFGSRKNAVGAPGLQAPGPAEAGARTPPVAQRRPSIDIGQSMRSIRRQKAALLKLVNEEICPAMHALGGGAFDLQVAALDAASFSVTLLLDVVDAMGANTINTALEKMKPLVFSKLEFAGRAPPSPAQTSPILMSICSNLTPERVTRVGFRAPVEAFAAGGKPNGLEVCRRICAATRVANLDLFRAVTHNKGIMNGVTAVLLALGQDTRAVESACHVYSVFRHGRYQSLSEFVLERSGGRSFLCGELEVPLSLGTVGGVLRMNPLYQAFLRHMALSGSSELAQVVACVGLANNLAALRALVTEGIQKGHMKLHAKNFAFSAGVPFERLREAVAHMERAKNFSLQGARTFLEQSLRRPPEKVSKLVPKL